MLLWDRDDQFDENSSYWMRVAQMSGGNQIGSQYIPQVGDEVGVMFEHGDPNKPIVTSAQYNSSNNEPYRAKQNPHVTAITTHTQGSKDPSQGHKLVFDDTPNKESLNLHSENDLNTNVLGDLTQTLQGGQTTTVNKHHLTHVLSGKAEFTAHEMHIHAGGGSVSITGAGIQAKSGGSITSAGASPAKSSVAGAVSNALANNAASSGGSKANNNDKSTQQSAGLNKDVDKLFYPSAKLSIDLGEVILPPKPPYVISLSMSAELKADSKEGMTEVEYNVRKNEIKINLKEKVANLFESMKIIHIDLEKNTMQINIQNIGTLTSTSFSLEGNQIHAGFTDNSIETTYSHWKFNGSVTLNLTVSMIPDQSQQREKLTHNWIERHLEENLMIGLAITEPMSFGPLLETHQSEIEQQPITARSSLRENIIAATLILTIILLAPVGA